MGISLPEHVEITRTEAARCAHLARTVDHTSPLPHLPGWTFADALAHLAGDFRWASAIITTRTPKRGPTSVRERGDALVERFDDLTEKMLDALAHAVAEPTAPCPNFAEGAAGTLAFWPRRQAHETTMHRWDLEVPSGAHDPIDAIVAADAIDELLHIYTQRYGGQVLDGALTIRCSDRPDAWRITPRPEVGAGRVVVETCHGLPSGDVEARAEALLLAMSHRIDPGAAGLAFRADPDAATAFLAGPLTA